MRRPCALAICLAAAVAALGGCGDDEPEPATKGDAAETVPTTTGSDASGRAVATVELEATEYAFDPANPGVESAGVVKFEVSNAGKVPHALEVEGPEGEVATRKIGPGSATTIGADLGEPGRYKFYCPIGDHEQRGMAGEVYIAYDKVEPEQEDEQEEEDPGGGSPGGY